MLRLTFTRPGETTHKTFEGDQVTLVPEDGLETDRIIHHPLPTDWNLPWGPWGRLNFHIQDERIIATNETKDESIKYNGQRLTFVPLSKGDIITLGNLQIVASVCEEEPDEDLDIDALLQEATTLIEPPPEKQKPPVLEKLRNKRRKADKKRALLVSGVAFTLFALAIALASLIHIEQEVEEEMPIEPMISYAEQIADIVVSRLAETRSPFPELEQANTLEDLDALAAAASLTIVFTHATDLKEQINQHNLLRRVVMNKLADLILGEKKRPDICSDSNRDHLKNILDTAHISHRDEQDFYLHAFDMLH